MITCGACDGKGGYATNHEGDEVETCASCDGTGQETCRYCDELAVTDRTDAKGNEIPLCESCNALENMK